MTASERGQGLLHGRAVEPNRLLERLARHGQHAALVGRAEGERVAHHVVAEEALGELLGVQVEVVLGAGGRVDPVELGGQLREALASGAIFEQMRAARIQPN